MTTAHRATFRSRLATKGENSSLYVVPTRQFAARDCPSYKIMKDRKTHQKDFHQISKKGELRRKQNELFRKITNRKSSPASSENRNQKGPQDILGSNYTGPRVKNEPDSSDEDADDAEFTENAQSSSNKKEKMGGEDAQNRGDKLSKENARKTLQNEESSSEDSDDSDDSDQSDDEEAILLEYERVKKEREEKERQEIKERVEEEGKVGEGYSLQKKWFQESVFRNQSVKEIKEKPEFCNDTVRSKFHKKVLHKFVWT